MGIFIILEENGVFVWWDYRGCAWEWGKVFGCCKLKINVIYLREAGGDKVCTWMGEILLALSHRASGRCCTAHCIFQLQFHPSDHCKPLCDLMFASLRQILAVGTSSFAPKLSEKMERTWLCKRVRQSLVSKHTRRHTTRHIKKVLKPVLFTHWGRWSL